MSAGVPPYSRTFPSGSFFILVEEFTAAGNLAVSLVLDFDPAIAIEAITTVLVLGDDTFKVPGAGKFKEAFAFALEMIHIKKMGRTLRNDAPQHPLALKERYISEIATETQGGPYASIRRHFDIGSFGINACVARGAGNQAIPQHDELGSSSGWELRDLDSSNGTFVDDQPLPGGGSCAVHDGALIGIGPDVKLKFLVPRTLYRFCAAYRERAPLGTG